MADNKSLEEHMADWVRKMAGPEYADYRRTNWVFWEMRYGEPMCKRVAAILRGKK